MEEKEIETLEEEKVEIVDHVESKYDDLKPRTEMVEITREEKQELVEKPVVEEPKKSEKKYKMLSGFGLIVTILYTCFALWVGNMLVYVFIAAISQGNVLAILLSLLAIIAMIVPYVLLYKSNKKKDKKLSNAAIIYEIALVIISVALFFLILWPQVQNSISSQWCGISDGNGNTIPCK